MIMFDVPFLMGAGSIVGVAVIDKLAEDYGWSWVGSVLKIVLPGLALGAAVWFLTTNPIAGLLL
jgi:hypothetical protein